MKKDNQWRSRETGKSDFAPYQRQRLKDTNWVTPEEGASISRHYNRWRKYWHRGRYFARKEPKYNLEKTLIMKYMNKPFEEFQHAWHERTKMLRNQGVVLDLFYIDPKMTDEPDGWNEYYVDMDGIIRLNPNYRRYNKKHPIKIVEKEVIKYHLKTDIHNDNYWPAPFRGILYILRKYLSNRDFYDILNGGISQETYSRLVNSSMYSGINWAIDKFAHKHNAKLIEHNPRAYRGTPGWCCYNHFTDLFVADNSESVYRYIYPGTPEFSRYMAEVRDATRKADREHKQQLEEYYSSLLHDIEADRKAREDALNSQKIAKHGFDEDESFRGEEYHGQKRKKRKDCDWAIEA